MYTSPSPLPRRDPLRLPFSVHIRKLFFLFLSLFSGAPRRTHPVGAGVCPSVCPAVAPFSHPVGAGVLDGPHRFSFMPTAGIFRAPARHPFAHGGKRMQKRRQKPTVFGFPFSDCNCIIKRSHNESPVLLSPLPLPCTTRRCHAPLVCNGGYCTSSPRCGDPKGGDAHVPAFWSLLGLRPKAARARKRGIVLSAAGRNGAAGGKKKRRSL